MLKAQRAAYVLQRLQELYPETPIPLDHSDPFTLLVAVLLSAQCTDERVNQVTPALFALADRAGVTWFTRRWNRSRPSSGPAVCRRRKRGRSSA